MLARFFYYCWLVLGVNWCNPLGKYACVQSRFRHVKLFATLWTIAHQAPLSMGFPRPEYWTGYLFPSPGNLPNSVIEPGSPTLQVDSLPSELPGKPWMSRRQSKNLRAQVQGLTLIQSPTPWVLLATAEVHWAPTMCHEPCWVLRDL